MTTERLDELTVRVLAPNPSPMTLEGTNTYLLGAGGSGAVVVVDPGPLLAEHRRAVDAAVARLDAEVAAVVITHHHNDHAEAAGWAGDWGASLHAFTPALVPDAAPLADGERVRAGGVELEAIHTPGHASDHLCLRVGATGVVLTGDHVLGVGTTVVAWPDGDMASYIRSLERLARREATRLYPGHGPMLHEPRRAVAEYLAHRHQREAQVLDAIRSGADTPPAMVARIYADVDPALNRAAERSVRAHLEKLVNEGRAHRRAGEETYVERLG